MTKEFAMNRAILHILNTASTLDEAKLLYHDAIAEILPFEFELEQADKQRELVFDFNTVIDKENQAKPA